VREGGFIEILTFPFELMYSQDNTNPPLPALFFIDLKRPELALGWVKWVNSGDWDNYKLANIHLFFRFTIFFTFT
jgi:hypothetical protein